MGVCNCSMYCCTLLYVHSSIAIILMGKRELIALLNLSSWCLVMVERLFLTVPRGCLQFVIVVFPDHTHLLFFVYGLLSLNVCSCLNIVFFPMNNYQDGHQNGNPFSLQGIMQGPLSESKCSCYHCFVCFELSNHLMVKFLTLQKWKGKLCRIRMSSLIWVYTDCLSDCYNNHNIQVLQ